MFFWILGANKQKGEKFHRGEKILEKQVVDIMQRAVL